MKRSILITGLAVLFVGGFLLYHYALPALRPVLFPPSINIGNTLPKGDATVPSSNSASSSKEVTPAGKAISAPLKVPAGFRISLFAEDLPGARVMAFDPNGVMFLSETGEGNVIMLTDADNDGFAEKHIVVLSGLTKPHGLAFYDGYFYVAQESGVSRYRYDPATREVKTPGEKILTLPSGGGHFTRTIGFGPADSKYHGKLFISVGSSCNVCIEADTERASILIANADGSDVKVFAHGLRNSVFFTWNTKEGAIPRMLATDMGRDWLGDDTPPDEINIIEENGNYGWPNCYGKNIHDTDFDKNTYIRNPCMEPFESPSYIDLQAHSAPLGIAVVPDGVWNDEYQDDVLVAYHGSWNRSQPTGYKVVRYGLNWRGEIQDQEDFITGWLKGGEALGRPVDIKIVSSGVMYISDDKAGVIYKIQPE